MAGTIDDIYSPSWHQAVMVFGQFTAITLSKIAFLRIFLEIEERKKMTTIRELAVTTERSENVHQNSLKLQELLQEREEIIRQLALFNKTAGMGALVASLAHELNQPLTAIQLNAELIDSAFTQDSADALSDASIKEAMVDLMKDNQRAATIIKTLRNMFGGGRKSLSSFDLNELVNDVLLLCKARLARNLIDLELNLHPQPLNCTGDKSQLQQVFLNLMTNANDAFPTSHTGGKRVVVQTELRNDTAVISVTDNGSGFPEHLMKRAFEPYVTTKTKGTGLGLVIVKKIIEEHGGNVTISNIEPHGARVLITLPVAQPGSREQARAKTAA
jgi:signal transduction histidine kinase